MKIPRILFRHAILIILVITFFPLDLTAQREQNNIFVFDCTGSMKKPNLLWEPAKNALDETILKQSQISGTTFVIIPFGNSVYQTFKFNAESYPKEKVEIIDAFEKYIKIAKNTNISDALKEAFKNIEPKKENNIYLLTDGEPNGIDSSDRVYQTIKEWCTNHKNSRLFYVALTKGAINSTIQKAIDECADAYVVQCENGIIPQIAYIHPNEIYTSLQELPQNKTIKFGLPGTYGVKAVTSDSLFDVKVIGNQAKDGNIVLSINSKRSQEQLHQLIYGENYEFDIELQCTDPVYKIGNPELTINVADKVQSKLTIIAGEEQAVIDGVKWYDSFLWCKAYPDQKVDWNLTPFFENQVPDSRLKLKFQIPEGEKMDFEAWFNGNKIKPGDIITIQPGLSAILQLQFNHDAKTGKRYFELIPESYEGIDIINGQPAEVFQGASLRTNYNVGWNPLKTFLFWLLIILVTALIFWFVIFRNIFFPKIKVGKIELTGPGSYFLSKRIKGVRKVVLTSKRKSQHLISRLFTGKVLYVRADHFTPEIVILPSGSRRKIKLLKENKATSGWEIYPASIFGIDEKGYIQHPDTQEKANIYVS